MATPSPSQSTTPQPGASLAVFISNTHVMSPEEKIVSILPEGFLFPSQTIDVNSATPYTDATKCKKTGSHIKRPMNAFMVWSQMERHKISERTPDVHNAVISKRLGVAWNELTSLQKRPFEREADVMKVLHKIEFPSYKYQPKKKKVPVAKPTEGKVTKAARRRESKGKSRAATKTAANNVPRDPVIAASVVELTSAAFRETQDKINERLPTKVTINSDSSGRLYVSQRKSSASAEVPSPSAAFPATPESVSSGFYDDVFQHQTGTQQQQQPQQCPLPQSLEEHDHQDTYLNTLEDITFLCGLGIPELDSMQSMDLGMDHFTTGESVSESSLTFSITPPLLSSDLTNILPADLQDLKLEGYQFEDGWENFSLFEE